MTCTLSLHIVKLLPWVLSPLLPHPCAQTVLSAISLEEACGWSATGQCAPPHAEQLHGPEAFQGVATGLVRRDQTAFQIQSRKVSGNPRSFAFPAEKCIAVALVRASCLPTWDQFL